MNIQVEYSLKKPFEQMKQNDKAQQNIQQTSNNERKNKYEITQQNLKTEGNDKEDLKQVLDQQNLNKSLTKISQSTPNKEYNNQEIKSDTSKVQLVSSKEITIQCQQNDENKTDPQKKEFQLDNFKSIKMNESSLEFQRNSQKQQNQYNKSRYQEQWNEIQDHEMIAQSSMDRKRQNLEILRQWDGKRAYFLNTHRSLLDAVMTKLDFKIQQSKEFMQFIVHYFQTKAQQEQQYVCQPIPKPETATMNNQLTNLVFGHFQKGLQIFDQGNYNHVKKISEFANTIQHQVLQELLVLDYNQTSTIIECIQDEISVLKKEIAGLNEITSNKSGKIVEVYNMSTPKTGYKKMTSKPQDLYKTQLNFLHYSNIQNQTQRKLAQAVLKLWQTSKELETIRFQSITKALQIYKQAYVSCYGDSQQFQESVEHIQIDMNEDIINNYFSIENIFTPQQIDLLQDYLAKLNGNKEEKQKQQLTFNQIIPFFENYVVDKFDNRMLILKDMKVKRQLDSKDNFMDSHLVITTDNYLHCFDSNEINTQILAHLISKPNFTLSLNKILIRRVSNSNFLVELTVQQPGLLNYLAESEKYQFKFRNSDEIEELIQLINSLN